MSFADELKADLHEVEAKIENFLHEVEDFGHEDEKAALADAKIDVDQLKSQVEEEAPEVEADASEALKNAVSDVSSRVDDVVEHPQDLNEDLESAGKEFETQERPAEQQLETDAEADARSDEALVDSQAHDLEHKDETDEDHLNHGDATVEAGPATGAPAENPVAAGGPALGENPAATVAEDPEEGTEAAAVKAQVDKLKADFDKSQEEAADRGLADDAETSETYANRFPGPQAAGGAGSVHQV